MNKHKAKLEGLKRRQRRVRGKVSGTAERPRLRVTRTNANIYAQIIDDSKGSSLTLVSASTLEAEFKGTHTALIGLAITAILVAYRVKGAIFIGIIATTLIGFLMGQTTIPESFTVAGIGEAFGEVAFKLDFSGALSAGGVVPFLTAIITFAICDCFDTVGTLLGTAGNAGMLDENGNFPGGDRALIADAIATCTGALLGTSTVTTFVESSTGIEDGGRTGLTSMTTGILFLLAVILAPVAGIVPSAATAPALIIVGVFMMKGVLKIDWSDMETAIPCFLTIAMMPFAYSIADGIGFGIISYTLIKLARGKAKEVPVLMYILSVLFILSYVLLATTAA